MDNKILDTIAVKPTYSDAAAVSGVAGPPREQSSMRRPTNPAGKHCTSTQPTNQTSNTNRGLCSTTAQEIRNKKGSIKRLNA